MQRAIVLHILIIQGIQVLACFCILLLIDTLMLFQLYIAAMQHRHIGLLLRCFLLCWFLLVFRCGSSKFFTLHS